MLNEKLSMLKRECFVMGKVPPFQRYYQKDRQDVDGDRIYIAGKRKQGL